METKEICDKSESKGINEFSSDEPTPPKSRTSHDNATIVQIPPTTDTPDARPSADLSEVDAKPIVWPSGSSPSDPISVPTGKENKCYALEGTKKVVIFNQKIFAPRLKLSPRKGTEIDVKSIQNTF